MCKEEVTLIEVIATVKEHKVHMVITTHLPMATSGSDEITSENIYFAGKQQKQKGVRRSDGTETDWRNSKGKNGVCFHCGRPGHVAAKCIADMPQEVKDHIVSGVAHITKEDKSDKSADDSTTEIVTFTRDNLHMFALMANTL